MAKKTTWEMFRDSSTVNPDTGCWEWDKHISPQGYGVLRRNILAHRYSYEFYKEKIPKGLHIDHLCRTRHCVNPDHLEAVTCSENVSRGDLFNRKKTHCVKGHLLSGENLYTFPDGRRSCRICRAAARVRCANKKTKVKMADRTHCPKGHEYTKENTFVSSKNQRSCKLCREASRKKYLVKLKEVGEHSLHSQRG